MKPSPPSVHFAPLDWAVLGLFVVAILSLGFSARLKQNSMLQFLAAGRSLTLPFFVATLVSTWYGGILGIGESASYYGFGTWLFFGVPYYVFALVYALVFAKRVRSAEQISIPERLELRWGKGVALLGAVLVFLLAVPAAHVLMMGTLIQAATGWTPIAALLVGAGVGTTFLYKGGLLADVRAGMLAFVMMYVGFTVIALWCLLHYPPGPTFATLENKSLLEPMGGKGPLFLLSCLVLGSWTLVDPGFHQRVASAASPETGKRGVFVSIGFWFLFDILSITTAMYALALLKPMPENVLQIFPSFGNQVLPSGLKAVFYCGMLGTILSAMVGYTLVSGATIGREIIGRVSPGLSEGAVKQWTRVGFFIACLLALVLALKIESVVALWYSWGGCIIGALIVPVCLAYLPEKRRIPSAWMFASIGVAFTAALGWLILGQRTGNLYGDVSWVKVGESWVFMIPPVDAAFANSETVTYGLGTLLPALVISGLIAGAGALMSGRNGKDG